MARRLLAIFTRRVTPAARLDAAPYDDEELTDEDLRAVGEAPRVPGISWSDAEAKQNLTGNGDRAAPIP